MSSPSWPAASYEDWAATCDTLHAHTQVLGKLAAELAPAEPQLQHAALRLTARGWETAPLPAPDGSGALVVALDLHAHEAVAEHSDGRARRLPLTPHRAVGEVTRELLAAVSELVGTVEIDPTPQEVAWSVPLDEDAEHATYEPAEVAAYFAAATQAALVLAAFRAPYRGRSSPVNAWWGSFDLAVNLFSGLPAEPPSDDFIMRNAGGVQQVEVGWWPGDGRYGKAAFYAPVAVDWPDDPATIEAARANPDVFAKKTVGQVADHVGEVIGALNEKPAVIGHSTGGLLTHMIAGRGLSAVSVAIDPGPFRGVLPLPASSLRSALPVLRNPLNRGRAITLTLDQFKYGWANALSEDETKQLYETYHVAAPGIALSQMANANLNPWTEAKADTKNPERGPLLVISGEVDHTVPWAIANASFKKQSRNEAVTEIVEIPNRGHSLTIDSGWREVAEKALEFVKRFT